MNSDQFEEYLASLEDEEYDAMMQERITRLNPEQQTIMQAREVKRRERFKLIEKLQWPLDEETHHMFFNSLRDDSNSCEHGRDYYKSCVACNKIDHVMFPELFDEDGQRIED